MPTPERLTVRLPGTGEGLRQASLAFEDFRRRCGVPEDAVWQLGVALDEVLSNTIGHGLVGRPEGSVEVIFELAADTLEVTVLDDGPAFDPLSLPAPDTVSPLDARRPGGLGIYFVKTLMDRVSYERRDGRNRLVFARHIASGQPESTEDTNIG